MATIGAAVSASLAMSITVVVTTLAAEAICRVGCTAETARLAFGDETLGSVLLYPLGALFVIPFAFMIVLPIMAIGYPLAATVARRSQTLGRAALNGALAALVVVMPILFSAVAISLSAEERARLVEGLPEALFAWSPAIATAGAAVGWIVARMHRSAGYDFE